MKIHNHNFKIRNLFLVIIILLSSQAFSQNVGINSDGSTPDASAMLDIKATDAGLLIPRVTLTGATDGTTITTPATSLLVWNTGSSWGDAAFYYNSGTSGSPVWSKIGAATIDGSGATNHVAYWSDANTLTFDNNVFYWDATNNRLGIGNNAPAQALDVTGNIRMSGTRSKLFYKGDGVATHEGALGIYTHTSGTGVILDPCDNTGTSVANSSVSFGGFGAFVGNEVSVYVSDKLGVNTQTTNGFQANITAANGNSGLYVNKSESLAGATQYGIYSHAENFSLTATETSAIEAVAESNNGDTYGVRGITEHSGNGDMYSVAGESWNFDQTTLNTAGYLGYYEGLGGTKGYQGYMGVLGIVEDNNGYVSENSYAGYFSNTMDQSTTTGNAWGIFAEANGQSYSDGDASIGKGIYASARNSETLYGIHGEAKLDNWPSQDLMTGVYGNLSWSGTNYAEGFLGFEDGTSLSGVNALIGVAGRVTNGYTNNGKITMAGYFGNEYRGTGGNKNTDAYAIYANSNGAGVGGSVNYGIYATASNAETNYAAVLDGDVKIGSNGTTVKNIIKATVTKDISDNSSGNPVFVEETFNVANAAMGSSVVVSPNGGIEDGAFIVAAWVSAANIVRVKFYIIDGVTTASRDWHITVIE